MKIGLVAPVKPSHLQVRMRGHRCLTSTICAFHLGFGLGVVSPMSQKHFFGADSQRAVEIQPLSSPRAHESLD